MGMRAGVAALALSVAMASAASAWNSRGHEQVADIAWSRMNGNARAAVANVLKKGDPLFQHGDPSLGAGSATDDRSIFVFAATFPDYIKTVTRRDGTPNPAYVKTKYEALIDDLNDKWHPADDPTNSQGEKVRMKTWHYYDTPLFIMPAPPVRESNALNALNFLIGGLDPGGDPARQAFWVYWTEHVVGDLHQPLHCASRYDNKHPNGDAGGNEFPLKTGELHAYWDAGIDHALAADHLTQAALPDVTDKWKAKVTIDPDGLAAKSQDVATWIQEGAELARLDAYADVKENKDASKAYRVRQIDACRKQAVLGGYRLANLLNSRFGQ